jgi:hypothetical protein
MPPPPLGSGKAGTPWARMHSENARKLPLWPADWPEPLPEVPQAVMARAQPMIAATDHAPGRDTDGQARTRVSLLPDPS